MDTITYQVVVSYPKSVLEQAAKFAWSRRPYRRMDLAVSVLLAAVYVFSILRGQDTHGWQAALVYGVVIGLIWCARWYSYRKARSKMHQQFARYPESTLRFVFTRDSITICSKINEATRLWKDINEVWTSPQFLILLFERGRYVLLPTRQLDAETRNFIMTRITEECASNPNFKLRS
jgi:hypothetical protein